MSKYQDFCCCINQRYHSSSIQSIKQKYYSFPCVCCLILLGQCKQCFKQYIFKKIYGGESSSEIQKTNRQYQKLNPEEHTAYAPDLLQKRLNLPLFCQLLLVELTCKVHFQTHQVVDILFQ